MKLLTVLFLSTIILTSCKSVNKIVETNNPDTVTKNMQLSINKETNSEVSVGAFESHKKCVMNSTYFYEEKKNLRPDLTLGISLSIPEWNEELDSVMFLDLDNEKIMLASIVNKFNINTIENNADRNIQDPKIVDENRVIQMNKFYLVPENLWVSIANAEKIQYRLYFGKEGLDVKLNQIETKKLKSFIELAINKRDISFPTLPKGKKKW